MEEKGWVDQILKLYCICDYLLTNKIGFNKKTTELK